MRVYRQRSGALLACSALLGLLNLAPLVPKACSAVKSCAGPKASSTVTGKLLSPQDAAVAPMNDLPSSSSTPQGEEPGASGSTPLDASPEETADAPAAPEETADDSTPFAAPPRASGDSLAGAEPLFKFLDAPSGGLATPASEGRPRPAAVRTGAKALAPGRASGSGGKLQIASPRDITPKDAETMLRQTGYLARGRNMTQALSAMETGYNQGASTPGVLDATAKEHLFREYNQYWTARQKYAGYPTISASATPQLFDGWIRDAASKMTSIPQAQREPLLRAATQHESRQVHWVNYVPTMGDAGDTGFGQALPAKALSFGFNAYDPGRNIFGMARALDTAYRSEGNLHDALGHYNGGPGWKGKKQSQAYANAITARL